MQLLLCIAVIGCLLINAENSDGFWSNSTFDVQNAYMCGCVKVHEVRILTPLKEVNHAGIP